MIESPILNNNSFKDCGGKLIAELIGGSFLYGLNNQNSDVDFRGVWVSTDPKYTSGLKKIESIVLTGEIDAAYYELTHFLSLLRRSNTRVAEILYAPESAFTYLSTDFKYLRSCGNNLIDSGNLGNSLKGYFHSELRLATGERTGKLGGKRKKALEQYSFSPKNFTQIFRLCKLGKHFFETGEFIVNVKDLDEDLHSSLMDIKNHPEKYNKEELESLALKYFGELEAAIKNTEVKRKFDEDCAARLISAIRERNL